jgi:hypothetical protein
MTVEMTLAPVGAECGLVVSVALLIEPIHFALHLPALDPTTDRRP